MPRIAAVGSSAEATADGSSTTTKADGAGSEIRVPFHKAGSGRGRGGARGGRGGGRGGSRGGRGEAGGKRTDPLKGGKTSKFSLGGK